MCVCVFFLSFMFTDCTPNPVFLLHANLMIPTVTVKPTLNDVQETLCSAGKIITGVAKGVSQWNVKSNKVLIIPRFEIAGNYLY